MEQRNTVLFGHGSAYNHGCEAIVRSTVQLLSLDAEHTLLFSDQIEGDLAYGLDRIIRIRQTTPDIRKESSLCQQILRKYADVCPDPEWTRLRLEGKRRYAYLYDAGETAISIGGDNYCYRSSRNEIMVQNYWLNRRKIPTILWGASIDEEFMTPALAEDLSRYALITVRERQTFELLLRSGVRTEVICGPDPAFSLEMRETPWPDGKRHDNVIGINISMFVTGNAGSENPGVRNYIRLIRWILDQTDCEVALIPHVAYPRKKANDIVSAAPLVQAFADEERVFSLDNGYDCCQLKYLISRCRFFVGARTHAVIAAYSTCVPTLAVGYSGKSTGIARDVFGSAEHYVCPVGTLTEDTVLQDAFEYLFSRETEICRHLASTMPQYRTGITPCVEAARAFL